MNPYENFARNLRQQCERFPSIAAVCAATEINRQQFNKYLSGKVLPNPIVLRKICRFLKVTEQALLDMDVATEKVRPEMLNVGRAREVVETIRSLGRPDSLKNTDDFPSLPEGYYFCYFPIKNQKQKLLRSLVWVFQRDGEKGFVRITYLRDMKKSSRARASGRHKGLVLASQEEFFMLGFNRYSDGQITVATIDRPKSKSYNCLVGITVTRDIERLIAIRMVMVSVHQRLTARELLRSIGIVDVDDPSVGSEILAALPELEFY